MIQENSQLIFAEQIPHPVWRDYTEDSLSRLGGVLWLFYVYHKIYQFMLSCVAFRNLEEIEEWKPFSTCVRTSLCIFHMPINEGSRQQLFCRYNARRQVSCKRPRSNILNVCCTKKCFIFHHPPAHYWHLLLVVDMLNSVGCCDHHELEDENAWTGISLNRMSSFMEDQQSCQSLRSLTLDFCLSMCGWMREVWSALLDNSN